MDTTRRVEGDTAAAKMEDDKGFWIELGNGDKWYPGRDDNVVSIENLANALSKLCRFTGHVDRFYSVAEHSVKVSMLVPEEYALVGLMHDAHEALVNDLAKPVKMFMGGSYDELEKRAEEQIAKQYNLTYPHPKDVKYYDVLMCLIEAFDMLPSKGKSWGYYGDYAEHAREVYVDRPEIRAEGWDWRFARELFLQRYYNLTNPRTYPVAIDYGSLSGQYVVGDSQKGLGGSSNDVRSSSY